jgi:hypothetical protein
MIIGMGIARAALSTSGRAKSKFPSIHCPKSEYLSYYH